MGYGAGASAVNAQISATSHPMTVHPRRRFKTKIAAKLRLLRPMMDGRKYNEIQIPSAIRWNINDPDPITKRYENEPADVPRRRKKGRTALSTAIAERGADGLHEGQSGLSPFSAASLVIDPRQDSIRPGRTRDHYSSRWFDHPAAASIALRPDGVP